MASSDLRVVQVHYRREPRWFSVEVAWQGASASRPEYHSQLHLSCLTLRGFVRDLVAYGEDRAVRGERTIRVNDLIRALCLFCGDPSEEPTHANTASAARLLSWIWRACRSHDLLQPVDISASDVIQHAAIALSVTDRGLGLRCRADDGLDARYCLPLDEVGFARVFADWWLAAEQEARLVIEEAWKYLHPDHKQLTAREKYRIASCFISALAQEWIEARRGDEDLSWHYCYFHKLRCEAARGLGDERSLEEALVAWLEVCHGEHPLEPAMANEIDAEREISWVLFRSINPERSRAVQCGKIGQSSRRSPSASEKRQRIPECLVMRDKERGTLSKLARWYARRHDLFAAVRVASAEARPHDYVTGLIGALLLVTLAWLVRDPERVSAAVDSDKVTVLLLTAVALVVLAMLFALSSQILLLFSRMIAGCAVGWLVVYDNNALPGVLATLDGVWDTVFVSMPLLLLLLLYLQTEQRRYLPPHPMRGRWEALKRMALVLATGYLAAFTTGLVMWIVLPPSMGTTSGVLWPRLSHLLVCSWLALGFGLVTQFIWDRAPMTEPL